MSSTLGSSRSGLELSGIHPLDMGEVSRSHPCISPAPKTWPHNPSSTYFSHLLQPVTKEGWSCDLLPVGFSFLLSPTLCSSDVEIKLCFHCWASFLVCTLNLTLNCSWSLPWSSTAFILHFCFHSYPSWGLNLGQLGVQNNRITHSEMRENYPHWTTSSCLLPFFPCALMTRHVVSCSISFQAGTSQRVTEKEVMSQLNLDSSSSLPLGPSRVEREAHTHTVA